MIFDEVTPYDLPVVRSIESLTEAVRIAKGNKTESKAWRTIYEDLTDELDGFNTDQDTERFDFSNDLIRIFQEYNG